MAYQRLDYARYFADTSEDYNKTGLAGQKIKYTAVTYQHNRVEKLLGLKHEVNYEMHYDSCRDVIQIHFQKTNGLSDWITNIAEFTGKYYDAFPFGGQKLTLLVHHGWGEMYKTIKHQVRDGWKALHQQHPAAETEIIGWSLGSGQAMLCCQDLNYNFGLRSHVFTFGSVRPFKAVRGQEALLDQYLKSLCRECCNFADVNDLVTYMPPFRRCRMINRVPLALDKRAFFRLLNPLKYHTLYDRQELYKAIEEMLPR